MQAFFPFFRSRVFGIVFARREKLGRIAALGLSSFLVFLGSWLSDISSIPRTHESASEGYRLSPTARSELASFWDLLLNKLALWQYAHTMLGAVADRMLRDGGGSAGAIC